jgi:hypothetical protein
VGLFSFSDISDRFVDSICSCRNSNEQHDKRHREIGALVKEIQEIDTGAPQTDARQTKSLRLSFSNLSFAVPEEGEGEGEEHWTSVDSKTDGSIDGSLASSDDVSHMLSSSRPSTPSPLVPTSKVIRDQKRAVKQAKQFKRVNKRKRHVPLTLTAKFIDKIQVAIHEYSANFSTADRGHVNEALIRDIQLEHQIKEDLENSQKTAMETNHIRKAMNNLGIEPTMTKEPKERRTLLEKLGNAIKVDIETVANEARETMKRQVSYLRYADRRAYNKMVREKQLFDWHTGKALDEVELEESDNENQGENEDKIVTPEGNEHNEDVDTPGAVAAAEANQIDESHPPERDLVLEKAPGTLVFSWKSESKSQDENDEGHPADSTEKEPSVGENPSPGRDADVTMEPIITHMKRRSRKKRSQRPLSEKKVHALNAKLGSSDSDENTAPTQYKNAHDTSTSVLDIHISNYSEDPEVSRPDQTEEAVQPALNTSQGKDAKDDTQSKTKDPAIHAIDKESQQADTSPLEEEKRFVKLRLRFMARMPASQVDCDFLQECTEAMESIVQSTGGDAKALSFVCKSE